MAAVAVSAHTIDIVHRILQYRIRRGIKLIYELRKPLLSPLSQTRLSFIGKYAWDGTYTRVEVLIPPTQHVPLNAIIILAKSSQCLATKGAEQFQDDFSEIDLSS